MNKNIILTAIMAISTAISAQTSSSLFFEKYAGQDGFTSVNISQKLFEMMAAVAPEDEVELKEMAAGLKGINILVYENQEGSLRSRELYKEADVAISLAGFDELMNVFDNGEKVRILSRQKSDTVMEELIILVGSDEEFVLVDIFGNIDLEKLSKLAGDIDMEGMEELQKLSK